MATLLDKTLTKNNGYHQSSLAPMSVQPLDLVRDLCAALAKARVNYCHWKSNTAIDRSATGDNDLDLLVHRADEGRFAGILHALGFKEGILPVDKQLPGVRDYYGYDPATGRLVHVHAHYQLILGHDATKNVRLPVEEAYLATARQQELFRLPLPEFELIIFVVRMALKHLTPDAILGGQGALSMTEKEELTDLNLRSNWPKLLTLLHKYLPFMPAFDFELAWRALQPATPAWKRYRSGQRLLRHLQGHTRRGPLADLLLKNARRFWWGFKRYGLRQRTRKRLAVGGSLVAIIGGDGAGKSTAVEQVYKWLSPIFLTERVHLGKPPRSLGTLAVKALLKVGRLVRLFPQERVEGEAILRGNFPPFPGYAWMVWHVLTARDRYRLYQQARRAASNGAVVIADRFPLEQVRLMDGIKLDWLAAAGYHGRLIEGLVRWERWYYDQIVPPDVLLVMRVNPDVARQRRADEDGELAGIKCQEIWDKEWSRSPAQVIDANQPLERVLAQVKERVWASI